VGEIPLSNDTTILILVVLILLSAYFSATETAFSSCNRIRIKYLANNGNKRAEKVLDLLDNFSPLLSTILIGNNIVNILSASIATVYFTSSFKENAVAYSSAIMTIIVLIFGEITPKTLAKKSPEKFALFSYPFINCLMTILKPITFIFEKFEDLLDKIFKSEDNDQYRAEEFVTLVEEAKDDDVLEEDEADLITNAIEFNEVVVSDIFTPRVDVIAVDIDDDNLETIEKLFRDSGYSRLPVYKDSLDHIVGVLHEKEFYSIYYKKNDRKIKDILQSVVYTSEHIEVSAVLKQLQNEKCHMAVVLDEYGGTAGIITMEDILEELVGEIYDEHDEVIEYYKKIDENTYLVNCDVEIYDFFEHFEIDTEEDDDYEFNTLSAFVIYMMNKIPDVGESFEYKNMLITVTKSNEKTVDEVKVVFNEESE